MTTHELCDYFDLLACNRAPAVPLLPAPRAIVPTYIPVQFPAIVPGLRVVRQWHDPIATFPTCEDYTVVAVLRGVVYVRHNTPELSGSITDKPLRTFWQGRGAIQTRYEAVTLQGHELRTIAAIHRANCAGRNYYMGRFNAGMDLLTPRLWERLQIEFAYRKTLRLLDAGLKVSA
jgi:hypothetical protein